MTIACRPQAAPRAQIRWEKDGAEVGTVLLNGDLHLTELTMQSSGRYTCVATNSLGEARSSCVLNVQGKNRDHFLNGSYHVVMGYIITTSL